MRAACANANRFVVKETVCFVRTFWAVMREPELELILRLAFLNDSHPGQLVWRDQCCPAPSEGSVQLVLVLINCKAEVSAGGKDARLQEDL